jgi:cytidyltransferase-like protein
VNPEYANVIGNIVYTGGTFDLLHPGHLYLLAQCRAIAGAKGKVVVSLNTDEFVREYKRIETTHRYEARREMLLGLRDVDLVVRNVGGADSKYAIEVVGPDIVAIGEDWKERDYFAQMQFTQAWLDARRIRLVYLRLLPNISATQIRNSLRLLSG